MAEGKKNRKIDRARKSQQNLRYKNEKRHEKSHIKRIERHLKRYSDAANSDKVAIKALAEYKARAGIRA